MKPILIVAIALILGGVAVLAYDRFSYTTTEEVVKIGPLTATAERTHTVAVPAILGWLLLAGGVGTLVFGLSRKS